MSEPQILNEIPPPVKTQEQLFEEKVNKYVEQNNPKVTILTPCYNGLCQVNYVHSLMSTIHLFQYFKIPLQVEFCKNDSLIPRARNNLVAKALYDPKTTHAMFIDADIQWNPIDLIKILISEKSVIGGAYPLKNYNWQKILPDQNGEQNKIKELIQRKNNSGLKDIISDEHMIRSNLLSYNINYAETENTVVKNLVRVNHLATGFLSIKREVFEKMIEAYPSSKYTDDVHFLTEEENKFAYSFFDCGVEDGHYLSEDWIFCSKWNKMGGSVWLDVSISLIHIGNENFSGSFLSTII
jgi:hypothetical protein